MPVKVEQINEYLFSDTVTQTAVRRNTTPAYAGLRMGSWCKSAGILTRRLTSSNHTTLGL